MFAFSNMHDILLHSATRVNAAVTLVAASKAKAEDTRSIAKWAKVDFVPLRTSHHAADSVQSLLSFRTGVDRPLQNARTVGSYA